MPHIPNDAAIDYRDGESESPADYPTFGEKLTKATEVTRQALETYDSPAVMWTGGKDSTLTLYFVRAVADEYGYEQPTAVFLDHFQHFPDVVEFVERWADEWEVDLHIARNEDVAATAAGPGDEIRVEDLNEENRRHVRDVLMYADETFPFLLDTYVGNYLLKTVPLHNSIEDHDIDGLISAVRWDEQEVRTDETFFSSGSDGDTSPTHDRVHPILQFTGADVWEAMWTEVVPETVSGFPDAGYIPETAADLPDGVDVADVPVSARYFEGYRSLGSANTTEKTDDRPAWVQDMEGTAERPEDTEDTNDLVSRLNDLGYM